MQTGSFGSHIGWKSGQSTFVPLWERMEGVWLWTRRKHTAHLCLLAHSGPQLTCVFFCLERETVLYNRVQEVSPKIKTLAHCLKAMLAKFTL